MSEATNNAFHIGTAPNGAVRLKISRDGEVAIDLPIPNHNAAFVAALLLAAAKDSLALANENKETVPPIGEGMRRINVLPSEIALTGSQQAECETLVFSCGNAQIGFDLRRDQLRWLGESLLALTATGTPQ